MPTQVEEIVIQGQQQSTFKTSANSSATRFSMPLTGGQPRRLRQVVRSRQGIPVEFCVAGQWQESRQTNRLGPFSPEASGRQPA